jgi:hypothetical protein
MRYSSFSGNGTGIAKSIGKEVGSERDHPPWRETTIRRMT